MFRYFFPIESLSVMIMSHFQSLFNEKFYKTTLLFTKSLVSLWKEIETLPVCIDRKAQKLPVREPAEIDRAQKM